MALVFDIKVLPASGSFGFFRDKNGELKCRLKSAPEKGRANQELIKGIAKALKLTVGDVEIVAGETVRKKKIRVHASLSLNQLCELLHVSVQSPLFPEEEGDS